MVRLHTDIRDRVQKNKSNYVLTYKGNYTQMWSNVLPSKSQRQVLFSCANCIKKRIETVFGDASDSSQICTTCMDFSRRGKIKMTETDVPKNYPKERGDETLPVPSVLPIPATKKRPFVQTNSTLKEGARLCFHNMVAKYWSMAESDQYCKELGINEALRKRLKEGVRKA